MRYILGLIILLSTGLGSTPYTFASPNLVEEFVDTIHFINNPTNCSCCTNCKKSIDNYFKSNKDMVENICNEENQNMNLSQLKQYLQSRGAEKILEEQNIEFDTFVNNLYFFLQQNNKMPELVTSLQSIPNWKFDKPSSEQTELWEERLKSNNDTYMKRIDIETSKGNIPFIAANHFYNLRSETDLSKAIAELKRHFNEIKPKAIVIEGFEVGKKLPCEYVLSRALAADKRIRSEVDLSVKIAFNNQIAIIPGDSQKIDDVDIHINSDLPPEELASLQKELQIVDFLHSYYSNLQKADPHTAAGNAIEELKRKGVYLTLDEVKSLYQKLNNRELPTDANVIYSDFTPSKHLREPKGTNLLVDKQDRIRNQGLVTAIQMGLINYGTTMSIYGSGHLPEVAPSLENR